MNKDHRGGPLNHTGRAEEDHWGDSKDQTTPVLLAVCHVASAYMRHFFNFQGTPTMGVNQIYLKLCNSLILLTPSAVKLCFFFKSPLNIADNQLSKASFFPFFLLLLKQETHDTSTISFLHWLKKKKNSWVYNTQSRPIKSVSLHNFTWFFFWIK